MSNVDIYGENTRFTKHPLQYDSIVYLCEERHGDYVRYDVDYIEINSMIPVEGSPWETMNDLLLDWLDPSKDLGPHHYNCATKILQCTVCDDISDREEVLYMYNHIRVTM